MSLSATCPLVSAAYLPFFGTSCKDIKANTKLSLSTQTKNCCFEKCVQKNYQNNTTKMSRYCITWWLEHFILDLRVI